MVSETSLVIDVDVSADIGYIMLVQPRRRIARTLALDLPEIRGDVNLDLDDDGRLIGIEIVGVSRLFPLGVVSRWSMTPGESPSS